MRVLELITDSATGCLSHTKIWSHIAYGTVTAKFIMTPELPVEIWFIYLGIVGSHNVLNNWITKKYGQVDNGTQGETGKRETVGVTGAIDISVK